MMKPRLAILWIALTLTGAGIAIGILVSFYPWVLPGPSEDRNYTVQFSWESGVKALDVKRSPNVDEGNLLFRHLVQREAKHKISKYMSIMGIKKAEGSLRIELKAQTHTPIVLSFDVTHPDVALFLESAALGKIQELQQMLTHGHEINERELHGRRTALMNAAAANRFETVAFLLDRGADPCLRDSLGLRAADYARNEEVKNLLARSSGCQ